MTDVSPVKVVDIDLTSFRLPKPPFWRSPFGPLLFIFGGMFLGLFLIFLRGPFVWLGGTVFVVTIVGTLGAALWMLPGLMRQRMRSSVPGERVATVRPEDMDRIPPGFDRTVGQIMASMQGMEGSKDLTEVVKREVSPEVRRHARYYYMGAIGVGVVYVLLLCVGVGGSLPTVVAMLSAFALFTRARRVTAESAEELISHDKRAPILFLRSFMDDKVKIKQWQRLPFVTNAVPIRFEEALSDMVGAYGPFLAIGEPDEGLPQLGAARAYPGDDEWQKTVLAWIGSARLITMLCGPTRWVHWEVQNIVNAARLNRLLLFLPPGRGSAVQAQRRRVERWDNIVKSLEATRYGAAMKALNIDDVLLIQFGANRLNVFRNAGDLSQDYALAALLAASLAADAPQVDGPRPGPPPEPPLPETTLTPDPAPGLAPGSPPTGTPPTGTSSTGASPHARTDAHKAEGAEAAGRGIAPATLWMQLGGVGLACGVLLLLTTVLRMPMSAHGNIGLVIGLLFMGAVSWGVARWGGREAGQWPRVLGAFFGAFVFNFVFGAVMSGALMHMAIGMGAVGRGWLFALYSALTHAVLVGAMAIACRPFRETSTWAVGLGVAFVAGFFTALSAGIPPMVIFPTALTGAWVGFGLSRRTLA